MSNTLPLAETLERIRGAFSPLDCAATAWDHDFRIKVTVFDRSGAKLFADDDLRTDVCTDPARLDWTLREIASRIKAVGLTLDNYS
ncbi:hypothetical protein ACSFA2_00645 [Variovorax sp. LT2P21]|uniref:hypothetical protein n=1 Tax=Variovorax sp. LT2P21 TaxID=3443731 RepID=UPI003F47EA4F